MKALRFLSLRAYPVYGFMYTWCLTPTKTTRLISDREKGRWGEEGGMEVGEEGDYISIATLSHQNDSCIKMGSDESHFNVSYTIFS